MMSNTDGLSQSKTGYDFTSQQDPVILAPANLSERGNNQIR